MRIEALRQHEAGRCVRIGNMHSAFGNASPMPKDKDVRSNFKKRLLTLSLNITKTHAFASSQGISSTDQCILAGDFNMTPTPPSAPWTKDSGRY